MQLRFHGHGMVRSLTKTIIIISVIRAQSPRTQVALYPCIFTFHLFGSVTQTRDDDHNKYQVHGNSEKRWKTANTHIVCTCTLPISYFYILITFHTRTSPCGCVPEWRHAKCVRGAFSRSNRFSSSIQIDTFYFFAIFAPSLYRGNKYPSQNAGTLPFDRRTSIYLFRKERGTTTNKHMRLTFIHIYYINRYIATLCALCHLPVSDFSFSSLLIHSQVA